MDSNLNDDWLDIWTSAEDSWQEWHGPGRAPGAAPAQAEHPQASQQGAGQPRGRGEGRQPHVPAHQHEGQVRWQPEAIIKSFVLTIVILRCSGAHRSDLISLEPLIRVSLNLSREDAK